MTEKQLTHKEVNNKTHNLNITIVVDGIKSPENTGMIFRIAEAFGVSEIILPKGAPEIENTKLKRAARSTQKTISSKYIDDITSYLKEKKDVSIIGLEITNQSKSIRSFDFDYNKDLILILGEEKLGISEEILQLTDACVHIDMFGKNSSMNVTTSLSIALYEITKDLI